MRNRPLVFFSARLPYEKTIRHEMDILTSIFKDIYFFPQKRRESEFAINKNVKTCQAFFEPFSFYKMLTIKNIGLFLEMILFSLFQRKNFNIYLKNLKSYVFILVKTIWQVQQLELIINKKKLHDAIFYDYWFEDSTLALALLKKRGIIKHAFCRVHGFDLYDERWKQGRVPFREFKVKYLDKIFPVSDYGLEYFKGKINKKYHYKLEKHYLGVKSIKQPHKQKKSINKYLVVSAARTIELKQIHKIPEILSYIDLPVHWIHFGDGTAMEKVKIQATNLPSNITYEFNGQVSNEEVLKFYSENEVDLFVSTSQSEGLPISMMEVISYGIPIVAYNITALNEIVTPKTGLLIDINANDEIFSETIAYILKNRNKKYPSKQVRSVFFDKFDYKKNYTHFAKRLIELSNQ